MKLSVLNHTTSVFEYKHDLDHLHINIGDTFSDDIDFYGNLLGRVCVYFLDLENAVPNCVFGKLYGIRSNTITGDLWLSIKKTNSIENVCTSLDDKKHITLGAPFIEKELIKVEIKEQTHRFNLFGKNGDSFFRASNGWCLFAHWHLRWFRYIGGTRMLGGILCEARCNGFPRYFVNYNENRVCEFDTLGEYNKFVFAVTEYNAYFGKPQIKEKEISLADLEKEISLADLEKQYGCKVKIVK